MMEGSEEVYEKQIEYAIIPLQVYLNPDLTNDEKAVFWLISCLDNGKSHCTASNRYMADQLQVSIPTITRAVSKLKDLEYIECSFDESSHRTIWRLRSSLDKYQFLIDDYNDRKGSPGGNQTGLGGVIKHDEGGSSGMITNKEIYDKEIYDLKRSGSKDPDMRDPQDRDHLFRKYSRKVEALFDYWNTLGKPLPLTKVGNTKSFKRAVEGIRTALSKCDNNEELVGEAMANYHEFISRTKLHPAPLANFVIPNPYEGMNKNRAIDQMTSWFTESSNGVDYLMKTHSCVGKQNIDTPDEYPDVTERIQELWEESKFCQGEITNKDRQNFKIAAKRMIEWLEEKEDNYYLGGLSGAHAVKKILFPALEAGVNGADPMMVTSGWLSSDQMFNQRIHSYLQKRGLYIGGHGGVSTGGDAE